MPAWQVHTDAASGQQYFFNTVTQESRWEEPDEVRRTRKKTIMVRNPSHRPTASGGQKAGGKGFSPLQMESTPEEKNKKMQGEGGHGCCRPKVLIISIILAILILGGATVGVLAGVGILAFGGGGGGGGEGEAGKPPPEVVAEVTLTAADIPAPLNSGSIVAVPASTVPASTGGGVRPGADPAAGGGDAGTGGTGGNNDHILVLSLASDRSKRVARSYGGYDWEVAPAFHDWFVEDPHWVLITGCGSTQGCTVSVPAGMTLVLERISAAESASPTSSSAASTATKPSADALASRFLMQATFGPTQQTIGAMVSGYGAPDDSAAGRTAAKRWIDAQVALPPTYHRPYYRQRTSPRMPLGAASMTSGGLHPVCMPGSRWHRHAFLDNDVGKTLTVAATPDPTTGKYALSVDGVVRTELDAPWPYEYTAICTVGEKVGGTFQVGNNDTATFCKKTTNVAGGNPAIAFAAGSSNPAISGSFGSSAATFVDYKDMPNNKPPKLPSKRNLVFLNRQGVGRKGGPCTCPDGQVYQIADTSDNNCNGMAANCVGGTPGTCNGQGGSDHKYSFRSVICDTDEVPSGEGDREVVNQDVKFMTYIRGAGACPYTEEEKVRDNVFAKLADGTWLRTDRRPYKAG